MKNKGFADVKGGAGEGFKGSTLQAIRKVEACCMSRTVAASY